VLGVATCLWLGGNIVILSMVKREHRNILIGYGPTIPLEHSSHWKVYQ
jgi:hypothetical protein